MIDHDHFTDSFATLNRAAGTWRLIRGEPALIQQAAIENVVHQRTLPRAGDTGDAREDSKRDARICVAKIVFARSRD